MEKYIEFIRQYNAMSTEDKRKHHPVKVLAASTIVIADAMDKAFEEKSPEKLMMALAGLGQAGERSDQLLKSLAEQVLLPTLQDEIKAQGASASEALKRLTNELETVLGGGIPTPKAKA